MSLIKMSLLTLVFFSCENKELANEYVFSETTPAWCVIVNGCKGGESFIEDGRRRFTFPKTGILIANIDDFNITKNDIFLIGEKQFDPNSEDSKFYKLCYFMISQNCGYGKESFDCYFFRVKKNCKDVDNEGLDFFSYGLMEKLKRDSVLSITN